jgi:glycosyltransferase involved in cell wall biosynthesis
MNRILLISHDQVGRRMAGPAIRFWELARVLARQFAVTLAVPGGTDLAPVGFDILRYPTEDRSGGTELARRAAGDADVVIASGHQVVQMPFLRDLGVPLVADLWIPLPIESLAWHALSDRPRQLVAHQDAVRATQTVAKHADLLLVASERQRAFWLGVLAACGRLHPDAYAADSDLRNLVDIVPVGCPAEPPRPARAIKGVWPGIGLKDRLILWTSGVWNWFDPMTLLRAMPQVMARHPDVRLAFIGVKHPNEGRVPEMEAARQARALSQELGLDGRTVFWGGWVPYAERGAYLLDADVGVSLHRTGLEPHFAFRARLLDCIWAGLPMVLTTGDVLGEEFEQRGLGIRVQPHDAEAVARALDALLSESDTRLDRAGAFSELRSKYNWARVAEPLARFCHAPRLDPTKEALTPPSSGGGGSDQAALQAENAHLKELVKGYEAGRVMRLMMALRRCWRRSGR